MTTVFSNSFLSLTVFHRGDPLAVVMELLTDAFLGQCLALRGRGGAEWGSLFMGNVVQGKVTNKLCKPKF